jgi:alpha-amylase
MLDVVVNNMAYDGGPDKVDYGSIQPLNKQEYYHPYCPIDYTNRTSTLFVLSPGSHELMLVLDGR